MRHDKKVTARNDKTERQLKSLIKKMRKTPSVNLFSEVSSKLDKSVKTNIIHLNRSSRLKSRLSKLLVASK